MSYILAIDQGTSSTRTIIFDKEGNMLGSHQKEHKQYYPQAGWVEHDPNEIKQSVMETMQKAVDNASISWTEIAAIGITNQRETVVAWDKTSGEPLGNAIVWQCRRTVPMVEELKKAGHAELFHKKTGLVLDAYFSGTKAKWMIDNNPKVEQALINNNLAFGTIDSWIIHFLTGEHRTDASNASRTLLFDINTGNWDEELSQILGVPVSTLPKVIENASEPFGIFNKDGHEIPIRGVLGDQQSALFGQTAFNPGDIKCTYGTGNFILLNTGEELKLSDKGLLTTVGWQVDGKTFYALEGSVFITGAALQWLRDGLGIFDSYDEVDTLTAEEDDANGVYFVPAFVGLGAPYWDSSARGTVLGITGGTNKAHMIHATLDAMAYQTEELVGLMRSEADLEIPRLRVDGGSTRSDILMQKQANTSQISIERPTNIETTALGAAFMAGYKLIWKSLDELVHVNSVDRAYSPELSAEKAKEKLETWKKAVKKAQGWV